MNSMIDYIDITFFTKHSGNKLTYLFMLLQKYLSHEPTANAQYKMIIFLPILNASWSFSRCSNGRLKCNLYFTLLPTCYLQKKET